MGFANGSTHPARPFRQPAGAAVVFPRHCGRSEAIHLDARQAWIASSASLLAMTAMQKLPDGQIGKILSSPFCKNISFPA
jgi:hypothetical protein